LATKTRYQHFCDAAPDLPLFMQPWYLDAVCEGGQWDVALVEKGGRVVAAWPYFVKRKWGWTYISMPPLTRFMGPYLMPENRTTQKETGFLNDLLVQMPPLAAFEQDFNYTATNWLPLYWRGFRQTTRYSYTLDILDLDRVWQNLAPDYRNQKIPKAREQVAVHTGGSLSEFYRVHNLSFERQSLQAPVSFEFLRRLDEALATHGRREIFFATDLGNGTIHSVAYLVWDQHSAYYLLAGDDPGLRASGAGILIAWEAIRYAHEVLHLPVFDFAGSMVQSIERVRRQFGARQQPYFRVQREWSFLWKWGKMAFRS